MNKKRILKNGTCIVFPEDIVRKVERERTLEKKKLGNAVYLSYGSIIRLLVNEALNQREQNRKV